MGLVIADEVRMIHDPGRVRPSKVTLTKLLVRNPELQVIALSATISNAEDLAMWLNADLVKDTWRPVPLREGVYFDGEIKFEDMKVRDVPPEKDEIWALRGNRPWRKADRAWCLSIRDVPPNPWLRKSPSE